MEVHRKLIDFVNTIVPLTRDEVESILSFIEYKEYVKGDYLTKADQVENYVYFLVEGGVRNFCISKGEEISLDFFFEGGFTNSFMSFLLRQPSAVYVHALADCKVLRIHFDHLNRLYEQSKNINKLGRIIAESLYIRRTRREVALITLSARERYDHLIATQPEFIRRIPLKYLATFLGINPETLSRIRKQTSRKKT